VSPREILFSKIPQKSLDKWSGLWLTGSTESIEEEEWKSVPSL
jgi:hypothetical protein